MAWGKDSLEHICDRGLFSVFGPGVWSFHRFIGEQTIIKFTEKNITEWIRSLMSHWLSSGVWGCV